MQSSSGHGCLPLGDFNPCHKWHVTPERSISPTPLSSEVISLERQQSFQSLWKDCFTSLTKRLNGTSGNAGSSSQVQVRCASHPLVSRGYSPWKTLIGNLGRNSTGDRTEASGILPASVDSQLCSLTVHPHNRLAQATSEKTASLVGRLAFTWGGAGSLGAVPSPL